MQIVKKKLESKIFIVRGCQVMLDSDLADIYKVDVKIFNQAIKRNIKRFPSSFRFQLSKKEWENLRSQFVTSSLSHGGRRYLPHVYTEQGVAMLASVLKSAIAIKVSIQIIQAFVAMRKSYVQLEGVIQRIENIESKQIQSENKIAEIFKALDRSFRKCEIFCFFIPFISSKLDEFIKKQKRGIYLAFHSLVIPLGLEPRTHTLKVYCSTN